MKHYPYMVVADDKPDDTRRAVLRAIARHPVTRRQAQNEVFGTDEYGATQTAGALRWLRENGYVVKHSDGRYSATDFGRANAHMLDMLDGGAA